MKISKKRRKKKHVIKKMMRMTSRLKMRLILKTKEVLVKM
jgi:hypothetical protein